MATVTEENPQITVVGPDDPSMVPVFKVDPSLSDYMTSPGCTGSPDLYYDNTGSGSSGGFPSPDTPETALFDAQFSPQPSSFDPGLGVGPSLYSPSSLSPSFNVLSLGDNSNQGNEYFGSFEGDKNPALGLGLGVVDYPPPDFTQHSDFSQQTDIAALLMTPEARAPSPSRSDLSPLIIPQPSFPGQTSAEDSWTGQADPGDEYLSAMMNLNAMGHSPFITGTMNIQTGYASFDNTLPNETGIQRLPRSNHIRATSEIHTPWTGSSHSSSPSVTLTPSEPNSSASLLDPYQNMGANDDWTFSTDGANIARRHSDVGMRRGGPSDRGRPVHRTPTSSANSSRRSSPYPPNRLSASPASPNQVYESGNHLAVPPADVFIQGPDGEGVRRRHSFTFGGRPRFDTHQQICQPPPQQGVNLAMVDCTASGPTTPTSSRKVASQAGIKASAARRTKEAKFFCDMCPQSFTTNHNLRNHINVHLGIKEHVCHACSRPFTTQSVLARHLKTCKQIANSQAASPSSAGPSSATES